MQSVYDVIDQRISLKETFQTLERLAHERRKSDSELDMILSKEKPYIEGVKPDEVLARHSLPTVNTDYRELLRGDLAELNPKYVHDGYVYTFRGDYPGLEQKGIFSFAYGRWNVNLDQMLGLLKDAPLNNRWNFCVRNKLGESMWMHSNGGYENFISTSTSFKIARKHPKYKVDSGIVYVIKTPVKNAFRNYASVCSSKENEIWIPDLVLPESIVAHFHGMIIHFHHWDLVLPESIVAVIDPKEELGDLDVRTFMPR
ncbi:MAG: hypothetical protein K0B02_03465 [DPANN group archaeon]|nr:hypothetical protein [DPANN group archaeon]